MSTLLLHRLRPRSPWPRRWIAMLAIVASSVASIVASSTAFAQVTVVDPLGRTVTLDAPPARIVSMMASHTETVCALGWCDALVGVDDFSTHPPEAADVPRLGSAYDGNVEAIVALEPDLVLVDAYSGLAEALSSLGIATYAGTPERLDDVGDVLIDVGLLLGARSAAESLVADVANAVEAARRAPARPDVRTVFLELDATPYSAGPDSYLGELLVLAGALNVVPRGDVDFPLVEIETILAADPDVILLLDAPYGVTSAAVAERPGWGSLTAVREGRVIELSAADVDLLSRAGPRVVDALERLVDLVYGPRP